MAATLLDAPKSPNSAKLEQFVETQLRAARKRVRLLDIFLAGLVLAVASLAFLLVVLLVDRYYETPRGLGWGVLSLYIAGATGFIYVAVLRPSRRKINPYFAARQVEQTVANSKNSLVTWVDFEEDNHLPGSIRSAIGQKAARDLKGVDLNRAIENRKILWLGIGAAVFLLANVVIYFLPATRTELTIEEPKKGDITVFNNQEVAFQVRVKGRIPQANAADAVRLRMWYNPDDPENFEERPLKASEEDRRIFNLIVPAKQVRNGFHYKVLGGNTQTPEYTVTSKIVPEFRGFEVTYQYPAYLKRAPETNNDSNLLAPYGSTATILVSTNREVKHGHIEIVGQARTIDGQLVEGRPDAIQFTVPIEKEGFFYIWYTTPEGDKNQDPARMRLGVIDPKPVVRTFDVSYEYPAYLRFKPMTVVDSREPELEAPRGTKIVLTAKTTRGVEGATLDIPGQPAVIGEKVEDQPMWVRFKLPALDQEGMAKLTFTPTTKEGPSAPREIAIRVLSDHTPEVKLTEPKDDEITLPANGTLQLKGEATDDHGVDKLTLRMILRGAENRDLKAKPYRGGMSFLRKEDNSWPTKVDYKDFVKLQDLRLEKDASWRVVPGVEIEYWLEALDNCNVPSPNLSESTPHKILKVIAPITKPDDQKKIEQQNNKLDQDQRNHDRKQDQDNKNQNRDVKQPPPKGAENQEKPENPPKDPANPMNMGDPMAQPGGMADPTMPPPEADPNQAAQDKAVRDAIEKAKQDQQPGTARPDQGSKVEPGGKQPEPKAGPMGDMPPDPDRTPMTDPNMDMKGEGPAGAARQGNVDKTKEDKSEGKGEGTKPMGKPPEDKGGAKEIPQKFGGMEETKPGEAQPMPKDPPMPMDGMPPEKPVDKGSASKEPKKADPTDPKSGDQRQPGATKPDSDVTTAKEKTPSGQPGPMGGTPPPPSDVAGDKPRESPEAGTTRPEPKKDQVADKGGSRGAPKDPDATAGDKPSKPMGPMDEEARGGPKAGPQPPPDKSQKPGELSREMGELSREINSANPEVSDQAKEDVDRLMRNPQTREQTRQELDKLERNAKDELSRKKAQDLRNRGEQAAKNYDKEKPTEEGLDKLAKKLDSKNEQERRDAEQRIRDWKKDQQAKKDLEKEVDQLKKKNPNAGEKVQEAMNKAEQANANKQPGTGETPKLDEKQLAEMAKNLNGLDEKAKADAQKNLDKKMQDPKTRQETQDKLKQMADKATGQDKKDLENAMKEAGKAADAAAKNDPKSDKLDPKALEAAAKKLASGDPKAQKEAQDQLKEMMKDPKAAKEAQDKLNEMAKNAKTDEDKKALENAAKQAGELAKNMGDKPDPKLDPKDLKDLAKQLADKDPKTKADADKKFEEMMKDPKTAEQAKKMLEEMAKNGKNSPEDQKALEDAMKQASEMAKKDPPKTDPKDLKELAKQLKNMDPKAKEELRKQLEKELQDPKKREEMKKAAQEQAKKPMTPEEQRDFNELMNQLGGGFPEIAGKPDPADPRNKLKSAELLLEDFKKNKRDIKPQLNWTDEQIDKWMKDQEATIAALRKQVEKNDWADRTKVVPGKGGIEKADVRPDGKSDPLGGGGRYAPPTGYVDPYKKLTTGGANEPKR